MWTHLGNQNHLGMTLLNNVPRKMQAKVASQAMRGSARVARAVEAQMRLKCTLNNGQQSLLNWWQGR